MHMHMYFRPDREGVLESSPECIIKLSKQPKAGKKERGRGKIDTSGLTENASVIIDSGPKREMKSCE